MQKYVKKAEKIPWFKKFGPVKRSDICRKFAVIERCKNLAKLKEKRNCQKLPKKGLSKIAAKRREENCQNYWKIYG